MTTDAELAASLPAVLDRWGLAGARVEPLGGGMNSATALVVRGDGDHVAKWVPSGRHDDLLAGARVAARLAATGLVTGPPRPTDDDRLVLAHAGGWVTVSRFVPGEPLTGDDVADQRDMARLLTAAHASTSTPPDPAFSAWLRIDRPALDVEPWVRPAVADALAGLDALGGLTHAWLHADPAPEAFRRADDAVGLIDWTGTVVGPVLYDVASAVMYLGGPGEAGPFLAAYRAAGVLSDEELAHLGVLLRYRWAVQAAYFADRITAGDLTGTDEAGNAKGLSDARRGLGA